MKFVVAPYEVDAQLVISSLEADNGGTEALDTEECEPMADE